MFYHLLKNPEATIHSVANALHIDDHKATMLVNELYFLGIAGQDEENGYDRYKLTTKFQSYGEEYDKLGWFKWLNTAWDEFLKVKAKLPEKRKERNLGSDWVTEATIE